MTWMSINHIVCFDPSRYDISPKVGVLTWFIHLEMGIYSQYSMKYPQKELPKLCGEDGDAMEILVFLKMWGNPKSSTFSRCFFHGETNDLVAPQHRWLMMVAVIWRIWNHKNMTYTFTTMKY